LQGLGQLLRLLLGLLLLHKDQGTIAQANLMCCCGGIAAAGGQLLKMNVLLLLLLLLRDNLCWGLLLRCLNCICLLLLLRWLLPKVLLHIDHITSGQIQSLLRKLLPRQCHMMHCSG